jgi:hypothetical protein
MKQTNNTNIITIGWREWLALPTLGIANIKVKVDTGARTSAIHADYIEPFDNNGALYVRFALVSNLHGASKKTVCEAPVLDKRIITSSCGDKECRYVIITKIRLGGITKEIELTLTNRSTMKFKMLLGRTALSKDFNVAPSRSYVMGRPE